SPGAARVPRSYDVAAVVRYAVFIVHSCQAETSGWVQLTHLDDFDVAFSSTADAALFFASNVVLEVYEWLVALDNAITQVGLRAAECTVWSTQCRSCTGVVDGADFRAGARSSDHTCPLVFRRQVQVEVEHLLA